MYICACVLFFSLEFLMFDMLQALRILYMQQNM